MEAPTIALVGRPNVGKSRLFNRLLGRRVSIVHDMPGVTRDIVAEKFPSGALLMDTGGIGATEQMTQKVIAEATNEQAEFAINSANLIIFVVDSQDGLLPLDEQIADKIRHSGASAILAINKVDLPKHEENINDFFKLGFEKVCLISAEHGRGIDELVEAMESYVGSLVAQETSGNAVDSSENSNIEKRIKICVAGKPNVGKSSIGNRLLGSKRLIVSDVAGTTRDCVKCEIDFTTKKGETLFFEFFDTAGVRAKRKINTSLDFLSTTRAKSAIAQSDVVMLVIDAMGGVTESDQKLAGEILETGAAVMLVVNKWDYAVNAFEKSGVRGYDSITKFRESFESAIRERLFFLVDSPIYFVSAKENKGMEGLLVACAKLHQKMLKELPTPKVNQLVKKLIEQTPPKMEAGRRFKVYYALQTATRPITLRLYCNRADILSDAYRRFLESGIRENFKLGGIPIKFDLVGKPPVDVNERLRKKMAELGITLKVGSKSANPKEKKFKKIERAKPKKSKSDAVKKHTLKKLIAKKESMRQKLKAIKTIKKR